MSVSVQQLLADVKRLAGRLGEHDSSADLLLSQAQAMYRQVDAMKEVSFSLDNLNLEPKFKPKLKLLILVLLVSRGADGTELDSPPKTSPGSRC